MKDAEITKLPTLYIPHGGGPCFFMDWTMGPHDMWMPMKEWLQHLGNNLYDRIHSILVISAHWEEREFTVNIEKKPNLFFDYYGFPPHTYTLTWPAPGHPELALHVADLLHKKGIIAHTNEDHGFDHGTFIPLKVMFPKADLPVVQLSLKVGLQPREHIQVGRALAELRKEGVLIVGSGMSFHNMQAMQPYHENRNPQASAFDHWLESAVTMKDEVQRNELLSHWIDAPGGRYSHPREEHLLPLMVAAGAANGDQGKLIFKDFVLGAPVSAFQFGE